MPNSRVILACAVITACTMSLAAYVLGAGSRSAQLTRIEARLDGIEAAQHNRVPDFRDRSAAVPGMRVPMSPMAGGFPGGARPLSAEQVLRNNQQDYQRLQRRFLDEPLNASWAGKTRQQVEDVLYQLSSEGVSPQSAQVDCRSRSCFIDLEMANSSDVDQIIQPLLTDIAVVLPDADMVQMPSADGQRMILHVFATHRLQHSGANAQSSG